MRLRTSLIYLCALVILGLAFRELFVLGGPLTPMRVQTSTVAPPAESIKGTAVAPLDGHALIAQNCLACHAVAGKTHDTLIAPPLWGIRKHYLEVHPEEEAFVAAMQAFLDAPAAEESLMPHAIRRFGPMPRLPFPAEEIEAIARVIYAGEVERPPWAGKGHHDHGEEGCESTAD